MSDPDSQQSADDPSDPERFRREGHALVDWIADYWSGLEQRPVQAQVQPGETRARLPEHPPETPEPFEDLLADLTRVVAPGLTHWQHPAFFGYFPANASGPSVLGELASAGFGVQGMLWSTGPAVTELETHVLDWLAGLLDLPARFRSPESGGARGGGVIQDSASSATLCAVLAARERAMSASGRPSRAWSGGPDAGEEGRVDIGRLRVYASEHAHSSVEKAVRIAGLGSEALRSVPTDADHRLDPAALEAMLARDRADGAVPCAVVATVGTTSSGAVDPVGAIADAIREPEADRPWLHVDAAWAGCAAVAPEHRGIHAGIEAADSYCTNPHKWLLTSFDCDAFYVADRTWLTAALSVTPEYLRNAATEGGTVVDYRDWQVPLGRRFRALKLWFVLRMYGAEGLRSHIRRHVRWTVELAERLAGAAHLQVAAPPSLGLLCLRHRDGDAATEALQTAVNADGAALLTHTRLEGAYVLRVAVGGVRTERRHVAALGDRVIAEAARLAAPESP